MQPNIPLDIQKLPDVKCINCGSEYFRQVFKVKNVPRLLSLHGQGGEVVMPVMICDKCGTPSNQTQVIFEDKKLSNESGKN